VSYPKKNKLDPFKSRLLEWAAEGVEQKDMLPRLRELGCSVAPSSLSVYLQRERDRQAEDAFLARITSGAQQNKKFDEAFKENPAPLMGQIMARLKVLTASLSTQAIANPTAFEQLDLLLRHLVAWQREEGKQEDREIARAKIAQADAAKGLLEDKALSEEQRTARMRELFGMPN
jgi:hypothetical protein